MSWSVRPGVGALNEGHAGLGPVVDWEVLEGVALSTASTRSTGGAVVCDRPKRVTWTRR